LPHTARAAAYDEGEGARCHQRMWSSSVAGPGHRGGCGRSPELPRWRCWPAWQSPAPGRTTPPLPHRRGRWRRGLRPGGPRPRGRADRPSTCRRSTWPGSASMCTAGCWSVTLGCGRSPSAAPSPGRCRGCQSTAGWSPAWSLGWAPPTPSARPALVPAPRCGSTGSWLALPSGCASPRTPCSAAPTVRGR